MNYAKSLYIETDRLIIKPYTKDDLDACFHLMQDKELFKYHPLHVMSYDEYKGLFNWLLESYEVDIDDDFAYSFNITLKDSGTTIGWCGIGGSDFNHNQKEIYYLIGLKYWNNGYGKEAAKALLDYGFRVMKLNEIFGLCKAENIASKKILEGIGLKFRYIIKDLDKEFDFYNGEPLYSLTREEYINK